MIERCACGGPLHYGDPTRQAFVQRAIDRWGPTVIVSAPSGSWSVPRHYRALHLITPSALPLLAKR